MSGIFLTVLERSVTAGLVILMVLVLRLCLRRAPRIFSYALWSVVLVRLLCPVSVSSPVSALGWTEAYMPELIAWTETAAESATSGENGKASGTAILRQTEHSTTQYYISYGTAENVSAETGQEKLLRGLTIPWLVGAAGMLGFGVFSMLRLRRRLRCSVCDGEAIYLVDDLSAPCVVGLLRPRIYLPSGLDAGERDLVLRHEWHHIRRGDPAIRLLAFGALCIHWFNPLVWAAYLLSGRDMEISCDEAVLRQANNDIRAAYAASVLNLSAGRRLVPVGALPFAESSPGNRIRHIMNYRKPAFWGVVAAAAICAAGVICLVTNPMQDSETAEADQAVIEAADQAAIEAAEQEALAQMQAEQAAYEAQIAALEAELADEEEAKVAVHGGRTALLEIKAREVENLQQRMEEFCLAYFNGDAETLKEFLSESYSGDIEVYEDAEVAESITMGDVIFGLPSTYEICSRKYTLQKSFILPGEDSMTYLTVDFVNEAGAFVDEVGDWRVSFYGMEK